MGAGGRNKGKQREPREGNSAGGLVTALSEWGAVRAGRQREAGIPGTPPQTVQVQIYWGATFPGHGVCFGTAGDHVGNGLV